MGWISKHWIGLLGALPLLVQAWKWFSTLVGLAGNADFVIARIQEPSWIGSIMDWLLNPPAWSIFPFIAVGLLLIYWDVRHQKDKLTDQIGRSSDKLATTNRDISGDRIEPRLRSDGTQSKLPLPRAQVQTKDTSERPEPMGAVSPDVEEVSHPPATGIAFDHTIECGGRLGQFPEKRRKEKITSVIYLGIQPNDPDGEMSDFTMQIMPYNSPLEDVEEVIMPTLMCTFRNYSYIPVLDAHVEFELVSMDVGGRMITKKLQSPMMEILPMDTDFFYIVNNSPRHINYRLPLDICFRIPGGKDWIDAKLRHPVPIDFYTLPPHVVP